MKHLHIAPLVSYQVISKPPTNYRNFFIFTDWWGGLFEPIVQEGQP